MSDWKIARLEEIELMDDGRCPWRPVRHHLGITAFGVNAWTGKAAGDRIVNEHDEDEPDAHEELYVVLAGRARFELDGESRDAPAGTFVFVPPGVKRTAFAEEPETTVLAVGSAPGRGYVVSGWELWASVRPLYDAGEYGEAADRAKEIAAANPGMPGLLYNLACCESLAGRPADALAHLRESIAGAAEFRDYAKGDSDFDAIRDEPGFRELVS